MSLALQLFFTFLFSCCMAPFTTTFAFSDSVFDAYIEFSTPFNIASEHKSVLQNITAVRGFTLILTITLPQRDFGMYLPRNAVDFEASVLCLTPLLPSLAGGHGIPAFERSRRCYALLPTNDMFFTAQSDFCWGEGQHAFCRARYPLPCLMLIPDNMLPRYVTFTLNASVAVGFEMVHVRETLFYLAFFDSENDGMATGNFHDDFDMTDTFWNAIAPPYVSLDTSSRSHLQYLDAIYTSWVTQPCPYLAMRPAHWTHGLRVCLPQHGDRSAVSVFWMGASREQLVPGIGLPATAGSGGNVYAMDCNSATTVPWYVVEAIKAIDGSLPRSHEWSWRFLPWCLFISSDLIFSPLSSFNPVYAADHASFNLSRRTPLVHLKKITRIRGVTSIGAMNLILNVSSNGHRIFRLDIGCRGWAVLLDAASPHSNSNWRPEIGTLQFVARLPVGHAVKGDDASWECASVLHEQGVPAAFQRLLPLQAHLRQFYDVIAWDHLSVSHISVTLAVNLRTTFNETAMPLKCSLGSVDVCDFCKESERAEDCLTPQLVNYLTALSQVCARLSPPCPGIIKMKNKDSEYKLVLSDNHTLRRIISWSMLQVSIMQGLPSALYKTVVLSHQTGAGLGNVWHSMMSALVLAILENAPLLVSFDVHPDSQKGRWDGVFSQAVDMASDDRLYNLTRRWSSGIERVVIGPGQEYNDFWACDWGRISENDSEPGSGKVFNLQGGTFPLLAFANDAHAHELMELFGHNMDFYLSHFLVSAAPALRGAADDFMLRMRLRSAFVIGIHMRWVTSHAGEQYLIPEDFHEFVQCASRIAANRISVGIYIASDSAAHASRLISALQQKNPSWYLQSAPVGSHTSDGNTFDALFDALVLSQCDDFIATAGSTFSHFAAALGAHLPVVIGGSVYSNGRSRNSAYRVEPGNYVWGIGFTGVKNSPMYVPWYVSRYSSAVLEMDLLSCTDQAGVEHVRSVTSQVPSYRDNSNSSRLARVKARILDLTADRYQLHQDYSNESLCQHKRFCV